MVAFADADDKIRFFFDEPTRAVDDHKRGGLASVLYLVRRELIETAGWDPGKGDDEQKVYDEGVRNRLFATLILIFSGFDLLAKFQLGDAGGVGDRFKRFLASPDGGQVDDLEARIFYGVRNSLVHSFSVPDADSLLKLGMKSIGIAHNLEGTSGGSRGVSTLTLKSGDTAMVHVNGAFRTWVGAVRHYRESLFGAGSDGARKTFETMFDKYGRIGLGP
jgi:hypothetical protein